MQKLLSNTDREQYASWMYWANSHGMPDAIPSKMQPVWFRCEHGSLHFLSWHRAYLMYFEELIRQVTQNDAFALPYWDWYKSSDIPDAFAKASSNPLLHDRQYKKRALLRDALAAQSFTGFSSLLEGNPHGTVHVMVGKDMGAVETSARDPLFWAHHTHIDRLWEVWRAKRPQNQNPSDPNWLKQTFTFDLQAAKRIEVSQLVDTKALGYIYDSVSEPETGVTVPSRPSKIIDVEPYAEESGPSGATGGRVLGRSKAIVLVAEPLSVRFKIGASDQARLSAVPESSSSSPPALLVRLRDIQVTQKGRESGFEYRLYVNLPNESAAGAPHETFYVGSINSFQLSGHGEHSKEIRVSLRETIGRQSTRKLWSNSQVLLSIVSTQSTTEPLVTIGTAELVLDDR